MRRRRSVRIMPTLSDKSPDSVEELDDEYESKNKPSWSLRNRFSLSTRKRSLRLEEKNSHPRRSIRSSCRIQVLSRSRSDRRYMGYQSDDDEDSMFGAPSISARRYEQHTPRHKDYREGPSSSKQEDGIRRSTRQRKLKYDNYSDSWIVGSQSLRGYPSLRGPSPFDKAKVKDEIQEDEEEEEEEDDNEGEKSSKPTRPMRSSRVEESRLRSEESGGGNVPIPEGEEKENGEASRPAERRTRQSKISLDPNVSVKVEGNEAPITENGFEDMYARVKQRRRTTAKSESSSETRSTEEEEEDTGRRLSTRRQKLHGEPSLVGSRQYSLRKKEAPPTTRFQAGSSSDSTSSSSRGGEERRPQPKRLLRRDSTHAPNRLIQRKYSLRQTKPTVQRFQAEPLGPRSVLREVITLGRRKRRRRDTSSSSSSSSSDRRYDRKKSGADRDRGRRSRMELLGGNTKTSTGLLADVDPVTLDKNITFANVGGLERHVTQLKEMVVFPILYPEVFEKFNVTPPKGVLFHGPPGTGKTLMARALANECSIGPRKVSFFMRKGADVLSKWVGESERQLRILFEEAQAARPSIIFFDELDGLAPVRSTKQDQIHASIVCTLLALMDGLDKRGDIVIIGATNRIDSIDPALRRPGRFDRELHFPLPGVKERREILEVHAGKWAEQEVLNRMAEMSVGYCGSDLRALCTEAVIQSLRRVYPQIYTSNQRLLIDSDKVKVMRIDFERAARGIVPAAYRALPALGRKLPQYLEPLLGGPLAAVLAHASEVFPAALNRTTVLTGTDRVVRSPRILITGPGPEPALLATSLLYKLEHCPMMSIGVDYIYSDSSRSVEESITRVFKELPHNRGSVLWFGDIGLWWSSLSRAAKAVFTTLLSTLDPNLPVLFLGTANVEPIHSELRSLFSETRCELFRIPRPTAEQKEAFFRPLFRMRALKPPPMPKKTKELEKLEVAPPPPPPKLTEEQMKEVFNLEENTLRELRIFLRQICSKLARNKQFYMFSKPVDVNEVPDYLQIIKEPMDLETMMTKIDLHKYTCAQEFLADIDLLCKNALEYNPDRDPADKLIRHRACYLRDTAYALIKAEMDSDFEISCRKIRDARTERDENSSQRFVQEFFKDEAAEEEESKTATETPDTSKKEEKRKVRRVKQSWSKGIVSKRPSKKLKQSPEASKDEEATLKSTSAQKSDEGCERMDGTEEPKKNTDRDETEASETEGHATEKEDERRLEVDREKLSALLRMTSKLAVSIDTIEPLIDLYSSLRSIIDNYRGQWDRTNLINDLERELKKFFGSRTTDIPG